MRPTRRELLAGVGTGVTVALAGCGGRLTDEGVAFGAAAATLPGSVQSETGYTHHRTVPSTVTRRFQRFGITRDVDVTNVVSEYDRAIELGLLGQRLQAAVFATLSTPKVEILGRTFNPVAEMSTADIAELVQERYDQIENLEADAELEMPVAGQETTVTRFTADARLVETGLALQVYLSVSEAVSVGGDLLVTLAVHPTASGTQTSTIERLAANVQHG